MTEPLRAAILAGPLLVHADNLHLLDLAREISTRKISVKVLSGPGPLCERLARCGVDLLTSDLTGRFPQDLPKMRALKQASAEFAPHVLHVVDPDLLRHGFILARATGTPLTLSLDRVPRRALPMRFGLLRAVLVPCRSIRDELVLRGRAPESLIRIVPPGIDLSRFPTVQRPFAGSRPVLGAIFPFTEVEGASRILEAVRLLLEGGQRVHLAMAGHGPADLAIRGLAREMNISRDVTVSTPPLDFERLISAFDVFVRPARPDGFGASILTAMAAGRPVVAEGAGPALSLVREGETGFLVPPADPGKMAERIGWLVKNPERAVAMGAAGRAAAEELGIEKTADEVVGIYRGQV